MSLVNQESAKAEKIVPIPFKLVKQLWECLREKQTTGNLLVISMKFSFKTILISRAVVT